VVGIAVDNTIFLGGSLAGKAFVAREDLARLMGQPERYTLVAFGLSDRSPAMVDEILGRLERHYSGLGLVPQAAYVEIEAAQEASRLLTLALMAMLALVALMGALGMLNTLALNVIERRREIAVLRALGATDGAIVLLYTAQGLLLAVGGWCLGLLLGGPIAWLLTRQLERVLFTLRAGLSLRAVLLSAAAALALGGVASLAPALGAARFAVSESLRYE
jgi:putative ABC transport system permease protein